MLTDECSTVEHLTIAARVSDNLSLISGNVMDDWWDLTILKERRSDRLKILRTQKESVR